MLSIRLIEDIHSCESLSEEPDINMIGFLFLPKLNTPKEYCFVRDSVLQIVEDLGKMTQFKTEPSLSDFNFNSTPFSIVSKRLISHHCFCHA